MTKKGHTWFDTKVSARSGKPSGEIRERVDFVFQDSQGNIVPLEGKSADNVKSKSLRQFVSIYKPAHSVRVSVKSFGYENSIKSIPLYALFCLKP